MTMQKENVFGPTDIEVTFNEVVENVKGICREARHMNISNEFHNELPKFTKFLDDVNFKEAFTDYPDVYIMEKMLDALDYILDNWVSNFEKDSADYRVANSIYDVIKEFYFNA